MFGQSTRDEYTEAYRTLRILMKHHDLNEHQLQAQGSAVCKMMMRSFPDVEIQAFQSYWERTHGIQVNWTLRSKLQNAATKKRLGAPVPGLTNVFYRAS